MKFSCSTIVIYVDTLKTKNMKIHLKLGKYCKSIRETRNVRIHHGPETRHNGDQKEDASPISEALNYKHKNFFGFIL
jgi:hypothetical protein